MLCFLPFNNKNCAYIFFHKMCCFMHKDEQFNISQNY